jgi:hypothetical protein
MAKQQEGLLHRTEAAPDEWDWSMRSLRYEDGFASLWVIDGAAITARNEKSPL